VGSDQVRDAIPESPGESLGPVLDGQSEYSDSP